MNRKKKEKNGENIYTKPMLKSNRQYDIVIVLAVLIGLGFPGELTTVTFSALDKLCEYGVFLLEIFILMTYGEKKWENYNLIRFSPQYGLVYLFIAVIGLNSYLTTDSFKSTTISIVHVSVTILFALWISENYETIRILELYSIAQELLVFSLLLFWALAPNKAFSDNKGEQSFCGIYTAKNSCGSVLAFGILMFLLLFIIYGKEKKTIPFFKIFMWFLQMVLMVLSNAKGALFCAVIPCIYVLFFTKTKKRIPAVGTFYVVSSIGFLIFALTVIPVFEPFFKMIGKDATLTGRIPLWNKCLKVITHNHFLTGYGYGQFWLNRKAVTLINTGFRRNSYLRKAQYGCHNVFLELLLNIGLIGIAVYCIMCIHLLNKAKHLKEDAYILTIAFTIIFMFHGFTERAFFMYDYHTLTLFIVLGLCANAIRPSVILRNRKYLQGDI